MPSLLCHEQFKEASLPAWILVPEMMTVNLEEITLGLWSSVEHFTIPLYPTERVQVAVGTAKEITCEGFIQLGCSAAIHKLSCFKGIFSLLPRVGADPLCQLGWKPSQDLVGNAVWVCDEVVPRSQTIVLNHIVDHGGRDNIFWIWLFEKMDIDILPATLEYSKSLPHR